MIQRIQTLYLLAATALMALVFFLPLMGSSTEQGTSLFYSYKLVDSEGISTSSPWYLMFLVLMAGVIPFGTIFRYKNRLLQIRMCVVSMVLMGGSIAMLAFYCYRFYTLFAAQSEVFAASFKLTLLCPFAALLFTWLAMRAIFRDEMLVRAADRIR